MRYLILFVFCLMTFNCFAIKVNVKSRKKHKYTQVRASVMNAGIGIPPHFIDGRMQLGAEIGLLHPIKKYKFSHWNYSLQVGYFAQKSLQRDIYLKPGIGYTFKVKKKIIFRPSLNFALMGVWQINDEFKFIGNGQYEKVKSFRMQALPSFGIESLIPVFKQIETKYSLLLRYEFGVQSPFSKLSSILPINQLHVGVNVQF